MRSRFGSALWVAGGAVALTIGDVRSAPPPRVTHPAVVTIRNHGGACEHGLVGNVKGSLHRRDKKKENADGIEWIIANGCRVPQYAVLCVYDSTVTPHPQVRDAFHSCDPADKHIGMPFLVEKDGEVAKVECRALKDGKYKKGVQVTSNERPCPTSIPANKNAAPRTHTLDMAIEP